MMPLSPETAKLILTAGAAAPSGDNLQPWIVERRADGFGLRVDPTRDLSLYNFQSRPALMALGAMIENMVIAARASGLATTVRLAADGSRLLSADLTFEHTGIGPDPLHQAIGQRCTNRKPYERRAIAAEAMHSLRTAVPAGGNADVSFFEDRTALKTLAKAASLNDRLLFEIKILHERFFETVRWTEAAAVGTRDGLFVDTLELGATAPGFKAMRSWTVTRTLNAFGSSVFAPVHSYQTFLRSAAFGFLQMRGTDLASYVDGGRHMQRLWLTATLHGVSFQPMAGMLYLLWYLRHPDEAITPAHRKVMARADALFRTVLALDEHHAPIMLFRLGYAGAPSARSLRRPL